MKITKKTNTSPKEVFDKIINGHYADRFEFEMNTEETVIGLFDKALPDCQSILEWHDEGLTIVTAPGGYKYELSHEGILNYQGPYMGFLKQDLLPDFE
jgi:hypothetical protein